MSLGHCRAFTLTFISYTIYCFSRTPYIVTKGALFGNRTDIPGWAPFNGNNGLLYLGIMDTFFLVSYSFSIFAAGMLGDNRLETINIRLLISFGMFGSGLFVALFGFAGLCNIHYPWYFMTVNFLSGLFQSTGWPANVLIMSRWFVSRSQNFMCFWDSGSSLGNILGKIIVGMMLMSYGWEKGFLLTGALCAGVSIIEFFLLVPSPSRYDPNNYFMSTTTESMMKSTASNNHSVSSYYLVQQVRSVIESSPSTYEQKGEMLESEDSEDIPVTMSTSLYSNQVKNDLAKNSLTDHDMEEVETIKPGQSLRSDTSLKSHQRSNPVHRHRPRRIYPDMSLIQIIMVPGVIPFSLCLFFAKFSAYLFIFWLPFYLYDACNYTIEFAAVLSIAYDLGAVSGNWVASSIAENQSKYNCLKKKKGTIAFICLFLAGLALCLFFTKDAQGKQKCLPEVANGFLILFLGMVISGPYSVVSSSIAVSISKISCFKGNENSMRKVTTFIGGCGSLGAALQGIIVGWLRSRYDWSIVLYMLITMMALSAIMVFRIVFKEIFRKPLLYESSVRA